MAKKLAALEALQPDIAVLSETLAPERESPHLRWSPSNASRLGIQVRSFGQYRLKRVETADLPNCVVPLRVDGLARFNLLAVWTWPAPSECSGLAFGSECHATHHFIRKPERPFHIDFCIVPRAWAQHGLRAQGAAWTGVVCAQ
jgi:hypothetical protein